MVMKMNCHVAQKESTCVEIRLIASVEKCFVNTATSKIVINAKQDTLNGSYIMTSDDSKIDWKDFSNIMMSTSIG